MIRQTRLKIIRRAIIMMLVTMWIGPVVSGQVGGNYDLSWSTIDSGGGTSSGGQYILTGTIGQPDTGRTASCTYHLSGGFWSAPPCVVDLHYFAQFSSQWLESGAVEANLDGLGDVDILDFEIFVAHWLCYCPGDWPWQ